jgi:hypothetical protein
MAKIEMTLEQLESLLNEQKRITVEKCLGHNYYYNKESTDGHAKSLPIDEDKFKKQGMEAKYPNDFEVLKKYLCG